MNYGKNTFEHFIVHSKKIQFVSWKTEGEVWAGGEYKSSNKPIKTKGEFFKDLLPGDIMEFSIELNSSPYYKPQVTVKAWRGDSFLGEFSNTFNKIANCLEYFNLKEID